MTSLPELFENNRRWARETEEQDPGFFARLSVVQFAVDIHSWIYRLTDGRLLALADPIRARAGS